MKYYRRKIFLVYSPKSCLLIYPFMYLSHNRHLLGIPTDNARLNGDKMNNNLTTIPKCHYPWVYADAGKWKIKIRITYRVTDAQNTKYFNPPRIFSSLSFAPTAWWVRVGRPQKTSSTSTNDTLLSTRWARCKKVKGIRRDIEAGDRL